MSRLCVGEAGPRRDDDPATVDYLREQVPHSQYNGYSLRRDLCSFDSTLEQGNRMTICSWRTQSPERPLNFVRPRAKLRNRKRDARPRVVYRCSVCTRALVGVPTYLPTSSCISHNCIRRGRFTFLHEKLLRPIRPSLMGQNQMVQNLRFQSQRKHPWPRRPQLACHEHIFAATALALAVSTCTGLIMGWKYARRKSIVLLTLAAGVFIAAILVFV